MKRFIQTSALAMLLAGCATVTPDGGFGDVAERQPGLISRDLADGKVSQRLADDWMKKQKVAQ